MSETNLKRLITAESILKAVQKFEKRSDIKIAEDVEVKMATSKVEGLLSTVLRVKAFYRFGGGDEIHSKSFIFKKLPTQDFALNIVKNRGIFQMEAMYFQTIVPIMEKASRGKVRIPLPECYHVQNEEKDGVIVMQDLAVDGYRTVDKEYLYEGLDLPHGLLAMRCLGRLHGLGIAAERYSKSGSDFRQKFAQKQILFYHEEPGEMVSPVKRLTENAMKILVELSGELNGLPMEAKASGALENVVKRTWNTVCEFVKPSTDGPNVLSHGDYWVLNLMFKYEDNDLGKKIPVDIKTIDFQLARYCHPSIDILHLLYLSMKKCLTDEHMESLLSTYHQSLTETLEETGIDTPPFTLNQLMTEVQGKYKPYGVIAAMVFKPGLLLGDDFAPANADELTSEELEKIYDGNAPKLREKFANNPIFRSRMSELIREFVEMALPGGPEDVHSSPLVE